MNLIWVRLCTVCCTTKVLFIDRIEIRIYRKRNLRKSLDDMFFWLHLLQLFPQDVSYRCVSFVGLFVSISICESIFQVDDQINSMRFYSNKITFTCGVDLVDLWISNQPKKEAQNRKKKKWKIMSAHDFFDIECQCNRLRISLNFDKQKRKNERGRKMKSV